MSRFNNQKEGITGFTSNNKEEKIFSLDFLLVIVVLLVVVVSPLIVYSITVLNSDNSLDKDSTIETLCIMLLICLAVVIILSLAKITFYWGHNISNSSSVSVFGPLIWQHGHHPPLPKFKHHEIRCCSKNFCCGCNGAIIGLISGISLILISEIEFLDEYGGILYFLGLIMVSTALLPYALNLDLVAPIRLFFNIFLPFGLCLIFISTRILFHSSNLVLLLVGLTFSAFFFIRIFLADINHYKLQEEEIN